MNRAYRELFSLLLVVLFLLGCAQGIDEQGGVSTTDNGQIAGIAKKNGSSTGKVSVVLYKLREETDEESDVAGALSVEGLRTVGVQESPDGSFLFKGLESGEYYLSADAENAFGATKERILLIENDSAEFELSLKAYKEVSLAAPQNFERATVVGDPSLVILKENTDSLVLRVIPGEVDTLSLYVSSSDEVYQYVIEISETEVVIEALEDAPEMESIVVEEPVVVSSEEDLSSSAEEVGETPVDDDPNSFWIDNFEDGNYTSKLVFEDSALEWDVVSNDMTTMTPPSNRPDLMLIQEEGSQGWCAGLSYDKPLTDSSVDDNWAYLEIPVSVAQLMDFSPVSISFEIRGTAADLDISLSRFFEYQRAVFNFPVSEDWQTVSINLADEFDYSNTVGRWDMFLQSLGELMYIRIGRILPQEEAEAASFYLDNIRFTK
jgi:hypothetical protein